MATTESPVDPWREVLHQFVVVAVQEAGFEEAEEMALENLTQVLQNLLFNMGRSARRFSEHSRRVESNTVDLGLALTEMGLKVQPVDLYNYSQRQGRVIIPNPGTLSPPKGPPILSSGLRQPLPSYIPPYFPPTPDPHTYIRTPGHKKPLIITHQTGREITSQQKHDLGKSLGNFIARASPGVYPIPEIPIFPLAAPKRNTYLDALVPRDQIFDEDGNATLTAIKEGATKKDPRVKKFVSKYESPPKKPKKKTVIVNQFLRPVKKFINPFNKK